MGLPQTVLALRPNRRGVVGQWLALVGAVIAIAATVVLLVTWPGHENSSGGDPGAGRVSKQTEKSPASATASAAVKPRD